MSLGCDATYVVRVIDRGGAVVATLTDLASVEWYRVLNDTSPCRVDAIVNEDCCAALGLIRSWRHSVAVYRNESYVWGGPITSVSWRNETVTINAGDVLSWLARRVPHSLMAFTDVNGATVAQSLIEDGYSPDDPGHETVVLGRSTVAMSQTYREGIGQTLDWLSDVSASGGIDFTAVGQSIFIMPDEFAPVIGSITDADMPDGLVVSEDGSTIVTKWHVYGQDNSGIYGAFGGPDEYYGLLERSVQDTTVNSNRGAVNAARGLSQGSQDASVYIDTQNVTLSPDANVTVESLVPGWALDITTTATCRDITQRLKITGLHVVADADGEKVQVQVGPLAVGIGE